MNNRTQIEGKHNTTKTILEKIAFIEAHGSADILKKLELALDLMARSIEMASRDRRAFWSFAKRQKSRPSPRAIPELIRKHPIFAKDRVALGIIAEFSNA